MCNQTASRIGGIWKCMQLSYIVNLHIILFQFFSSFGRVVNRFCDMELPTTDDEERKATSRKQSIKDICYASWMEYKHKKGLNNYYIIRWRKKERKKKTWKYFAWTLTLCASKLKCTNGFPEGSKLQRQYPFVIEKFGIFLPSLSFVNFALSKCLSYFCKINLLVLLV